MRYAALWPLDPAVAYLNHGSFGACPTAILGKQAELRSRMEREPTDFLVRDAPRLLADARGALGEFVGADAGDVAFVPNATTGINAVARSLAFAPGDEILTTDHAYGACKKTLDYVASLAGARVVVAPVPLPLAGADEVAGPVLAAVTPKTRLAVLDHVTSPTALVFPVGRLVAQLAARGVDTLVDGAHALGMVPLDLDALGAAYYTSNAHKWLCAPKTAAFLHVRRDRQKVVHPVSISHGYAGGDARFRDEFDWTGTADPTPALTVPDCIAYLGGLLPGGWQELMERNRNLALRARKILLERLDGRPPCPDSMLGAMAALPLPSPSKSSPLFGLDREQLSGWLRARGVESWFHPSPSDGAMLVRLSAQLYNTEDEYVRLAGLLAGALGGG
jgi:isopenicillin-N epimerase